AGNYSLVQPTGVTANITALNLAVTGATAANKTYDALLGATISGGSIAPIAGDVVTLDTSGRAGLFGDKNVGTSKAVTVSGYTISGTDAGNYALVQPTGVTANITALTLAVTGATAANKTYDALLGATVSGGTIAPISGDAVSLDASGRSGLFGDKNVGTSKAVTVSGYTISGTDAGNYALVQPTGVTANITQLNLAVTGATAASKTYDALLGATISGGVVAPIAGDVVTLDTSGRAGLFGDKNVGTVKAVTVSGYAISGTDAGNYSLVQPTGVTADISQRTLNLSFLATDKVYDGGTGVNVSAGDDRVAGDFLSVTFGAAFDDKNVGTGKTVSVTSLAISGTDSSNYSLASATGSTTGAVTRLASVSWIGGASGNWFDPANWAGGAVPDLSNVGQVDIPSGVEVTFGLPPVAPAQAGAVNLLSLGSGGSLDMRGGVLNVAGNSSLARMTQSGGIATFDADLTLGTFAQTGGQLIVGRDFTVGLAYDQGAAGTVTVSRNATLNAPSSMAIGNLFVSGQLSASVAAGVITLVPGTSLSGGSITLTPDPRNQGQGLFLVLTSTPYMPVQPAISPVVPEVTVEPVVISASSAPITVAAVPVPSPEPGVIAFGQALVMQASVAAQGGIREMTVEVPAGFVPGRDALLAVASGGLQVEADPSTGSLRITGQGTAEDYEKVLRSLALRRSGDGPARVRISLTDGSTVTSGTTGEMAG
ncbi:MAG: YDG domain-containing protein, partial [Verrucomicrobiota bacterium]